MNIASMQVSRDDREALVVLNCDSPVTPEIAATVSEAVSAKTFSIVNLQD